MSSSTADFVYYNARQLFATAQLNWPAAAVNAMVVSGGYSPQLTHVNVSDIPASAILVRDLLCTNVGVNKGVCFSTIPTFTIASPFIAVAVILYVKGSDDAHSPLIYYSSSGTGFPFLLQGFTYLVAFDSTSGGWFQV